MNKTLISGLATFLLCVFLAYLSFTGKTDLTDRERGAVSFLETVLNTVIGMLGNIPAAILFFLIGIIVFFFSFKRYKSENA